jgi:hypothetical protein
MHFHSSHLAFHAGGQRCDVSGSCWDIRGTQGGIRLAQIAMSHMAPFSIAHSGFHFDGSSTGRGAIATPGEAA